MLAADPCINALLKVEGRRTLEFRDASGNEIEEPSFEQVRVVVIQDLLWILVEAAREKDALDLDEQELRTWFRWFMRLRWLDTESVATILRVTVPLENFRATVEGVSLDECLALKPFGPSDKNNLTGLLGRFGLGGDFISIPDLSGTRFQLTGTYAATPDGSSEGLQLDQSIERTITALRLLKEGDVGASTSFLSSGRRPAHQARALTQCRTRRHGDCYQLEQADLGDLNGVYQSLVEAEKHPSFADIEMALRRFNQSYMRTQSEDRLVDSAIALDSCLLPDTKDEMTYKLSLRVAVLLASERTPWTTMALVKALYNSRSSIVHSGKYINDRSIQKEARRVRPDLTPQGLLKEAESLTRATLRALLRELAGGTSRDSLVDKLNLRIVDGLARPAESL